MRVLILTLVLFLAGCAFGPKMRQVNTTMSEAQVIQLLGEPDGFVQEGDHRALKWANRTSDNSDWSVKADYWVVFEGERIVAYGPGEVRRRSGGTQTLMFIPVRM